MGAGWVPNSMEIRTLFPQSIYTPVSQPLSLPEHGDSSLEPVSTPVPTHSQSPLPTAEATPDVAGDAGYETLFWRIVLCISLQTEVSQDVLVPDDHSDTPFLANSLQQQLETQSV